MCNGTEHHYRHRPSLGSLSKIDPRERVAYRAALFSWNMLLVDDDTQIDTLPACSSSYCEAQSCIIIIITLWNACIGVRKNSTSQESLQPWDIRGLLLSSTAPLCTERDLPRRLYPSAHHTLTQLLTPWPCPKRKLRSSTVPPSASKFLLTSAAATCTQRIRFLTEQVEWRPGLPTSVRRMLLGFKSLSRTSSEGVRLWYAPWPVAKESIAEVVMLQGDDRGYLRDPYDTHHGHQNLSQLPCDWSAEFSCHPENPLQLRRRQKESASCLRFAPTASHQMPNTKHQLALATSLCFNQSTDCKLSS